MSNLLKKAPAIAKRVLTTNELAQFDSLNTEDIQARWLAKRFSAKEALVKAIGTGIGNGISWQHAEVIHDDLGKPSFLVTANIAKRFSAMGIKSHHLSISDEQHYAVATVIVEGS